MFEQIGKILLLFGICIVVIGGLFYLLSRLGVQRLPGDLSFGGKNWRVHILLGTSLLLSVLLTALLYLISRWRQ